MFGFLFPKRKGADKSRESGAYSHPGESSVLPISGSSPVSTFDTLLTFLAPANDGDDQMPGYGAIPVPGRSKSKDLRLVIVVTPYNFSVTVLVLGVAVVLALASFRGAGRSTEPGNMPSMPSMPNDTRLIWVSLVLGYNTWNAYHCDIDEDLILETAKQMKSLGLADLGYDHVNIDDCYSEKKRDFWGNIVAHKKRFPSGMNHLTDQIHALGLKAGIYSDSGWFTCQLYPGSFQNEERDAKLFQDWGFDYLKYDNCAVPFDAVIKEGMVGKYTRMANAIADLSKKSGKPPLIFSLSNLSLSRSSPGFGPNALAKVGELPMTLASRAGCAEMSRKIDYFTDPVWRSIASIINQNSFYASASDFYGHNDMDILEVGNGDLTYEESKSHFTAWALMKSPLLIGTDLSRISKESLEIMSNTELIAINQDSVIGTSITPFRWGMNPDWTFDPKHPAQYWSGETQNGTVFMFVSLDESSCGARH
ncbi:hypothetical protein AX17_007511 [Amanita inopinata Kibby_2008]|nr:hypothetical protein AX17_007511 [Amanita inopinata Kibby_2008]